MSNQIRILLNAEPFGFGPSAAIASIAPLLIKKGVQVSYIGEKHTLDLQKSLPYRRIYDISNLDHQSRKKLLVQLSSKYSYLFTAMDFHMAALANQAGLKTIIYDALTWYWPTIYPATTDASLYIAQNFFGVTERIASSPSKFPHSVLVGPIVNTQSTNAHKEHVLLNLGGLQNPFWEFEDTIGYAKAMLEAVKQAVPQDENLVVATSAKVAAALNDPMVKTYDREDMITLLQRTKYAIMTPGLGNIYDAAAFSIPTVWLPPANDSQGQQTQLLVEHGCCDAYLDWSDVTQDIDYKTSQTAALKAITSALQRAEQSTQLQQKLNTKLLEQIAQVSARTESKTRKLLELFGESGDERVAAKVVEFIKGEGVCL
jgi:hypothetical protein